MCLNDKCKAKESLLYTCGCTYLLYIVIQKYGPQPEIFTLKVGVIIYVICCRELFLLSLMEEIKNEEPFYI